MRRLSIVQREFTKYAKEIEPHWWSKLSYEEQYYYMKSHPGTKLRPTTKPPQDLAMAIINRKKYKGGLSDEIAQTQHYLEYIRASTPSGYYGTSNRTPEIDKMVEESLREKGLGNNGIAYWLTSSSARHMMDDMPDKNQAKIKERIDDYTRDAFKNVTVWSHPDHGGTLASTGEFYRKMQDAFCKSE